MLETDAEVDELQALMDGSLSRATEHLRSIITPDERTLTARQLVGVITGMSTLSIATVTARGEPRVSAVDGHFLHGRWVFGTSASAAKARHLAARPAVSVSHLRGEDLGVFTHGFAEPLNPVDGPKDPWWPSVLAHLNEYYGQPPLEWDAEVSYYRLRPSWMVAYAGDPAKLLSTT
jgi:hypothetical protein